MSDPEDYWPESGFRERGFVPDDDFGWHDDKDEE